MKNACLVQLTQFSSINETFHIIYYINKKVTPDFVKY